MVTMVVAISKAVKDLMVLIIIHLQPLPHVQEQLIQDPFVINAN